MYYWFWTLFKRIYRNNKFFREYRLILSRAGEEVLKWYEYDLEKFKSKGIKIFKDVTASSAPVSLLYEGIYNLIVVSPATSNTVAQMKMQ